MQNLVTLSSSQGGSLKFGKSGLDLKVQIEGVLNEELDFGPLIKELEQAPAAKSLEVSLDGVTRLNSMGVRQFIRFLSKIPNSIRLSFSNVSEMVIDQANHVPIFSNAKVTVTSFFGRYVCDHCGIVQRELMSPSEINLTVSEIKAPQRSCLKCKKTLAFDDVEEDFFRFLKS